MLWLLQTALALPPVSPPQIAAHPDATCTEAVGGVQVCALQVPGAWQTAGWISIGIAKDPESWVPNAVASTWGNETATFNAAAFEVQKDLSGLRLGTDRTELSLDLGFTFPAEPTGHEVPAEELLRQAIREHTVRKPSIDLWKGESYGYAWGYLPNSTSGLAHRTAAAAFDPTLPGADLPPWHMLWSVKPAQVQDAYRDMLMNHPLQVFVTGPQPVAELTTLGESLVAELGDPAPWPTVAASSPEDGERILGIDVPNAPGATVLVVTSAPLRTSNDWVPFQIGNFILGGSFLSRLNATLREEKGLTYGVHSSYDAELGTWKAWLDVDVERAWEAADGLTELLAVEDVTQEEVDAARATTVVEWNRAFRNAQSAANALQVYWSRGRTPTQARETLETLDLLSPKDVEEVVQRYLAAGKPRLLILTGPRDRIMESAPDRGENVRWLDGEDVLMGAVW